CAAQRAIPQVAKPRHNARLKNGVHGWSLYLSQRPTAGFTAAGKQTSEKMHSRIWAVEAAGRAARLAWDGSEECRHDPTNGRLRQPLPGRVSAGLDNKHQSGRGGDAGRGSGQGCHCIVIMVMRMATLPVSVLVISVMEMAG